MSESNKQNSIVLFKQKQVRRKWVEDEDWNDLKTKLKEERRELNSTDEWIEISDQ